MTPNPVKQLNNAITSAVRPREILSEDVWPELRPFPSRPWLSLEEAAEAAIEHLQVALANVGVVEGNEIHWQSLASRPTVTSGHPLLPLQRFPLSDALCASTWKNRSTFVVTDTQAHPETRSNWLVKRYGIQSYVGVPLFTSAGQCLGILEVMDYQPRIFSPIEIVLLEMIARCCAQELDQHPLALAHARLKNADCMHPEMAALWQNLETNYLEPLGEATSQVNLAKFALLTQLTQSLRGPLTPVVGMTSVLRQQVYGNLTVKQREYLDVVYQSSQDLLTLINEIVEISQIDNGETLATPSPVDLEMLFQQTFAALESKSIQREQRLRLNLEDGARIWLFDRDRIRQCLYHLIVAMTVGASPGSTISFHLARRDEHLRLVVWASHPWLGDGLRQTDLVKFESLLQNTAQSSIPLEIATMQTKIRDGAGSLASVKSNRSTSSLMTTSNQTPQEVLRVVLSQKLAEVLGGELTLQGSAESGYRLVMLLPAIQSNPESLLSSEPILPLVL